MMEINMKKILLMVVVTVMATNAMAQIPDNVKEVLRKCEAKMESYNTAAGTIIEGTVKMKVSIVSFSGPMKMCAKDKKFFASFSMNAMKTIGINVDMGFDGEHRRRFDRQGYAEDYQDARCKKHFWSENRLRQRV